MHDRYCDIRARTLEEVLATCERHIQNINLTELDLIAEEDYDEIDSWYIDMFRRTWQDLRDDVERMLNERRTL